MEVIVQLLTNRLKQFMTLTQVCVQISFSHDLNTTEGKLTPRQAPSTYTHVRTRTINVPITEVKQYRKDKKLAGQAVSFFCHSRALTYRRSGFDVL